MSREREVSDGRDDAPSGAVFVDFPGQTPLWRVLSRWLQRLEAWLRSHGGHRLRVTIRGFWALVAALGILLLVGPVINKPLSFEDITSSAKEVTNTWFASSFTADYRVVRGDDDRLDLTVEEHFTAVFPDGVNESTIERVVATQYEGHDLAPTLRGVSLDGTDVEPIVRTGATQTTYVIDAGRTLTGSHDVVLRYDLRDVAHDHQDESSQQWYQLLEWDVFGPDWPHGVTDSHVRVTVPRDLVGAFARAPSGGIAWLLASDAATLDPEDPAADPLVYSLNSTQNMPPYASMWFSFRFAPGTFAMPGPSPLFYAQALGPFVPLLLLAASVLFAWAARAVAWADARGRAWFVAESQPRAGSSLALDAHLWRSWRTSALAEALEAWAAAPSDRARERRLVRTARRTGRVGDLPRALMAYRFSSSWREQFDRGLRRVPTGFVRDGFIAGPIALTAVQWGLVRQLSYQVALTQYWWPVAIVAASTVLAAIVLWIALAARPLTEEGALAHDHLRGQRLHAEQTSALGRSPLRSVDLRYAVLFAPARRAGRTVRELLVADGADRRVSADPDFVGAARLCIRAVGLLVVAGAIALTAMTTASTRHAPDAYDLTRGLDGGYGVFADDVGIDAVISRDETGAARVDVVQKLHATVASNLRAIPQVTWAWRDVIDGHDQRLRVTSITVDGAAVPFEQFRRLGHAVVQTRLSDEWSGEHAVEVRYSLDSPAVSLGSGASSTEAVDWTALVPRWDSELRGVDVSVQKLHVAMRMPTDLAARLAPGSGWMDETAYAAASPPRTFGPMTTQGADTIVSFDEDVEHEYDAGSLWPSGGSYGGVVLRFAPGTFSNVPGPNPLSAAWQVLPWVLGPMLAAVALVLLAVGALAGRDVLSRRGVLRDVVRWLPVCLTIAQLPLIGWATADTSSDDPLLPVVLIPAALSSLAVGTMIVAVRRSKAAPVVLRPPSRPTDRTPPRSRPARRRRKP